MARLAPSCGMGGGLGLTCPTLFMYTRNELFVALACYFTYGYVRNEPNREQRLQTVLSGSFVSHTCAILITPKIHFLLWTWRLRVVKRAFTDALHREWYVRARAQHTCERASERVHTHARARARTHTHTHTARVLHYNNCVQTRKRTPTYAWQLVRKTQLPGSALSTSKVA